MSPMDSTAGPRRPSLADRLAPVKLWMELAYHAVVVAGAVATVAAQLLAR